MHNTQHTPSAYLLNIYPYIGYILAQGSTKGSQAAEGGGTGEANGDYQ
jgi:hypothetical protein